MPLESEQKFTSPAEEIEWLKKRLEEKKTEAEKTKENKEQKELISEAIKEHVARQTEQALVSSYKIPEKEVGARVLELKKETHDAQMEELLGIFEEKGILNAVSVSRGLGPHIEDDFHRVLVQYLLGRLEKPGSSSAKAELFRGIGMILYEIVFPQEEPKPEAGKTFKDLISGMEQFYSGMAGIAESKGKGWKFWFQPKPYFVLELALPAIGEEISFYAAMPAEKSRLLEKQLLAVFPKAQLKEKKDDYNIFQQGGVSLGAVAKLKMPSVLPIRTYDKLNVDPMEVISNAFSKLKKEGEGAALQIVVSPSAGSFNQKIKNVVGLVKKGESLSKALSGAESSFGKEMFEAVSGIFGGGSSKNKKENEQIAKIIDEEILNLLNAKASRDTMSVNIRLLVSAKTKEETVGILNELKGAFLQFVEPSGNAVMFKDAEGKKLEKLFRQFSFRIYDKNESIYLNTAELTSIYHFPVTPLATPKVKYLKAKDAPPPPNLPDEGLLLGKNVYRDEESLVYMEPDDRRRHLYMIGQTGTGKSVLMQNLIIQDIKAGRGVCVIDPHGDAVGEIL
ncbi:MAG: DUF87 domain-containing protein, partial [bacterium]|nr:DUF87 domain-containing protein [bacterium]